MKLEHGMKCPICGEGVLEFKKTSHEITYQGNHVLLEDLDSYICNVCGDGFDAKESERRQNIAFADLRREQEGLLTSEEIKLLRKKSGLTQEQLSLLLGMAPKTIARYENGIAVQSRSTDFLLRLLRDNPSNLTYLGNYASIKPSSETENLSTE